MNPNSTPWDCYMIFCQITILSLELYTLGQMCVNKYFHTWLSIPTSTWKNKHICQWSKTARSVTVSWTMIYYMSAIGPTLSSAMSVSMIDPCCKRIIQENFLYNSNSWCLKRCKHILSKKSQRFLQKIATLGSTSFNLLLEFRQYVYCC